MNLPTNKLRDLIAVLQTLDPDTEIDIASVRTIDQGGRRILSFTQDESRVNSILFERLSDLLTLESFEPDDDTLEGWADAINTLGAEIEKLTNAHADLEEKYDDIYARLSNIRETLQSAISIL